MFVPRRCTETMLRSRQFISKSYSTAEYKEAKIKMGKWDINYMKVGKGSHHVLLMPGTLGTMWTHFTPQIEGFDRDKFTLVAWDPPGFGKSRPPHRGCDLDYLERDADYAHGLMKALNIAQYSVLGYSDGGTSSFVHAAKYPEAVTKLVAVATKSYLIQHELDNYKKLFNPDAWPRRIRIAMQKVYGDSFVEYWAVCIRPMEILSERNNGDLCSDVLKDIKCPTFILYGAKDPLVDIKHAAFLQANIPNTRSYMYPEGKHNIHLRFSADFNERVQTFLLEPIELEP